MKKIYFLLLFWHHNLLQFLSLKPKRNFVIKIWWDDKMMNTFLYANIRSGLLHLPIGRRCADGENVNAYWLASYTKMEEYGVGDKTSERTIYSLHDIHEPAPPVEIDKSGTFKFITGNFDRPKSAGSRVNGDQRVFTPATESTCSFDELLNQVKQYHSQFRPEMIKDAISTNGKTRTFLIDDIGGFQIYKVD